MKKLMILTITGAASLLASQMAMADFKVRVGAASGSYSLDYTDTTGTTTINADYTPINLGASYIADNGFYVDLGVSSGTGTHDWYTTGSEAFKRTDVALIAGKSNVRESGLATTFFAGLKTGQTTMTAGPGYAWTEDKFTASGVVGGFGLSFPLGGAGFLGVNAGIGIMGATWKDNQSPTPFEATADAAVGFSFGLAYTYPITDSMGVVVDYKGNAYSYVFNSGLTNEFTILEKTGAFGASFYAKF